MPKIKKYQYGEHITYMFKCPACDTNHSFNQSWTFNDDYDKPTVSPSLLLRSGHYMPEHDGGSCWCTYNAEHPDDTAPFKCGLCHSFVTDGKIQYLSDCSHDKAGQTLDIPEQTDY